jgi:hypothetical protein
MVSYIFPNKTGSSNYTIDQVLGPMDADYYDVPTSQLQSEYVNKIAGVLSQWGSVSLPYSYYNNYEFSFFENNSYWPPVIAFHGKQDITFKYKSQDTRFSPSSESDFNKETYCLIQSPFKTDADDIVPDLRTYGGQGFLPSLTNYQVIIRPEKYFVKYT